MNISKASSITIVTLALSLMWGAPAWAQTKSRLKLLVGPDEICVTPTQCFTSKPDPVSKAVVTTCKDTKSQGGCASFAVACVYGGSTYEGNKNNGKCTTN